MNEVISTSGDLRRLLCQTMSEVKAGTLPVDRAMAVSALSKEITASLQIEVNTARVGLAMLAAGHSIGEITNLGRLVIGDDGGIPVLSGK